MSLPEDFELESRRTLEPMSYDERMRRFNAEMVRQTAEGIVMRPKPLSGLCKHHKNDPEPTVFG
jgi:hypothetical protein